MKKNKLILPILTGVLFAAAANSRADVDVTITGSTAFRNIVWDRVYSLFDGGIPGTTIQPAGTSTAGGASSGTINGTMTALFGASTPVHIRMAFNGSVAGLQAVDQGAVISTKDPVSGASTNVVADIAFADNFPASCSPAIPASHFVSDDQLGVVVFSFVKNQAPGLASVTNITKELAWSLYGSGGTLPAAYLGGSGTDPVYLVGRDNGSGTRVTVTKDTSYTSGLSQYGTNAAGQLVTASSLAVPGTSTIASLGTNSPTGIFAGKDGYDSGGLVLNVLATSGLSQSNLFGYAGLKDAESKPGVVSLVNYQGVQSNVRNGSGLLVNVANGSYPLWGYEHASYKASQSDANKIAFFNALVAAIKDTGYQTTNSAYSQYNVPLSAMVFSRGSVDGGSYTAGPAF